MLKAIGVIPARLGSTRLREKVLKPIMGRPMIQHVWDRAKQADRLSDVLIACDDPSIEACVKEFGGTPVMTRTDHPNGTSRVAEAASRTEADIIINIQGDEPMIHPSGINELVDALNNEPEVPVATLAVKRDDPEELQNPDMVKVVCDKRGRALYFSRAPIPHLREPLKGPFSFLKHLGIYGYRKDFLEQFIRLAPGKLEGVEKLEQLRILERGFSIRVIETQYDSLSVDTQEDLEKVEVAMGRNRAHA